MDTVKVLAKCDLPGEVIFMEDIFQPPVTATQSGYSFILLLLVFQYSRPDIHNNISSQEQ